MKEIFRRSALIGVCTALVVVSRNSSEASDVNDLRQTVSPTPPHLRRVGVAYALWHYDADEWKTAWGHPKLGNYLSSDRQVMRKHAELLRDAGVDFILLDWSNSLGTDDRFGTGQPKQLMLAKWTKDLFDEWSHVRQSPKISIMIGNPLDADAINNGRLREKADQVYEEYVANPRRATLLEMYLGKPLLVIYVNTPTPYPHGIPNWRDDRFTIRWMTGFVTDQRSLVDDNNVSRFGYWSWEDRGEASYPIVSGHPEIMTVVAAWRGSKTKPSPGRLEGRTYRQGWSRARALGPRYVLAGTFNEWRKGEQPSSDISKDIEPSVELGDKYIEILRQESALFKVGK